MTKVVNLQVNGPPSASFTALTNRVIELEEIVASTTDPHVIITQSVIEGDTENAPSGDAVYTAILAEQTRAIDAENLNAAAISDEVTRATDAESVLTTAVSGKEPSITSGTTDQVWQGDKTWTSKLGLPISTATQAALDLKAPIASPAFTGDPTAPTPALSDNDTSLATTAFVHALEIGNVLAYGADPTGNASSSDAFDAAIAAAGVAFVPRIGTFYMSRPLVLGNNKALIGINSYDCRLVFDYADNTKAAIVAGRTSTVKGIKAYYNDGTSLPSGLGLTTNRVTGSETTGQRVILEMDNASYFALQRGSYIGECYFGNCGTAIKGTAFSVTFGTIEIGKHSYKAMEVGFGTGCNLDNVYINGSDAYTPVMGVDITGPCVNSSVRQLNIEHQTYSECALNLAETIGLNIATIHLEGVDLSVANKGYIRLRNAVSCGAGSVSIFNSRMSSDGVSLFDLGLGDGELNNTTVSGRAFSALNSFSIGSLYMEGLADPNTTLYPSYPSGRKGLNNIANFKFFRTTSGEGWNVTVGSIGFKSFRESTDGFYYDNLMAYCSGPIKWEKLGNHIKYNRANLKVPTPTQRTYVTGAAWKTSTHSAANQWRAICWSPDLGLFCAVSQTGTATRVMTSPDGITWTTRTSAADNNWQGVCWSPDLGLFCAVASSGTGNRVMTSPDGITWTTRTSPADASWNSVCWSPELGIFCAVSNYNGDATTGDKRVMTSPDGVTWTIRNPPNSEWRSVCWSPELGLFVACSITASTSAIMVSRNGIDWYSKTTPSGALYSICWSPELGLFCAVSNVTSGGGSVLTSPDGSNWTARTVPSQNTWFSVCWSPELGCFYAVGQSSTGNRIMWSSDGITWTLGTSAQDNAWNGVCWSPDLGLFCAVSQAGTNQVQTSISSKTFTYRS